MLKNVYWSESGKFQGLIISLAKLHVLTTGRLYHVASSYKQLHSSMAAYTVAMHIQMH
jgi:hypothetical protein